MEPRLKWNKIILAAKIISFHFRRRILNEIKLFKPLKIILATKIILFHLRHGSVQP